MRGIVEKKLAKERELLAEAEARFEEYDDTGAMHEIDAVSYAIDVLVSILKEAE